MGDDFVYVRVPEYDLLVIPVYQETELINPLRQGYIPEIHQREIIPGPKYSVTLLPFFLPVIAY